MAPRLPTSTISEENHDADTETGAKDEKNDVEDEKQKHSDGHDKEQHDDIKKPEKITFESLVSQQLGEFGRWAKFALQKFTLFPTQIPNVAILPALSAVNFRRNARYELDFRFLSTSIQRCSTVRKMIVLKNVQNSQGKQH